MSQPQFPLAMDDLRTQVESGEIDTVVVAFTDMQGRLQGKRIHAQYFLDTVLGHGTEGCNYLLAVDVDMNTVDGYEISSWSRGYGDMEFVLDLSTFRLCTWLPGTAMVQCDLAWLDEDHSPVLQSPRTILKTQVERAADRGLVAFAGTELEFNVYNDTFEDAWSRGYQDLTPANQYNVDYSLLGTSRVEPLLRDIRNHMYAAGLRVESAKGECNLGQHEIAFIYEEVVRTADQHAVYKNGAKEIASLHGQSVTFMAKFDEREGNSCHIHMSVRGDDGKIVFDEGDGPTKTFEHFVAGVQETLYDFTLLYAPNINSYKRFAEGLLRADGHRVGSGQPHLRAPGRRTRCRSARREPPPRRRRQPLPRPGRHARGRSARHRERAGARAAPSRATPTSPTSDTCRRRCRRPATRSRPRRWHDRPSATRSSTTT